MSGVVGWLASSLWGGGKPAASASSADEATNPNDETINYSSSSEDEGMMEDAPPEPVPAFQPSARGPARAHAPAAVASSVLSPFASSPSPSPFSPSPHDSVSQRLSFGAFSPSPAAPSQGSFFAPPTPSFGGSSGGVAAGAASAAVTPDALLRHAFAAHEAGQLEQAASMLERLARTPDAHLDSLVSSLARRTGDSRHLHQGSSSAAAIEGALVGELRNKATKFEALVRFVRTPLVRGGGGGLLSLWACLTHTAQTALLQTGELLECALALKLLLNAPPASLHRGADDENGVVSEADAATVTARRSLAFECMQALVSERADGPALLREGLSPQDVFFSETSRLPSLLAAVQAQLAKHEERSVLAPATDGVPHAKLARINAAAEIVHTVLVASASFRAQQAHAVLFAELALPTGEELPAISWILGGDVRSAIKALAQAATEAIAELKPGVKVVSPPAEGGRPIPGFSAPTFQATLFEYAYRATRVYLQSYTDVLACFALMTRQAEQTQAANLPVHATEMEDQLHSEFVRDRAQLLALLQQAARDINKHNAELASVFHVPTGGLPGVPEPKQAPYQPMYELAQEFQDYSALVQLSLSEPSRSVSDRRLVFFLAHYGHAFLVQLFEELMAAGQVARLLELAPVASTELPGYVREKRARNETMSVRDATGELIELAQDGTTAQTDGVPLYDAWLAQLLKPFPQHAWLHELYMEQYDETAKLTRSEARAEKEDLAQKKNLLSFSKLALLASAEPTEGAVLRNLSDASLATAGSETTDATVNPNELQALNDELAVVAAQEFLQSGQDADVKQAVLPPNELVHQLLLVGCDQAHPAQARAHAFGYAFDVLEKVQLPRPRTTTFAHFSRENQDALTQVWRAIVEADQHRWTAIAASKQADSSDSWQAELADTQLALVWEQLLSPAVNCYLRPEVYTASFLRLLQLQPSILPSHLATNEVRIVLESCAQLMQAQQQQRA